MVLPEDEEGKKNPPPKEEKKEPSDTIHICKRFFHTKVDYCVFGLYQMHENHMIEVRSYNDIFKITVDDRSYDSK